MLQPMPARPCRARLRLPRALLWQAPLPLPLPLQEAFRLRHTLPLRKFGLSVTAQRRLRRRPTHLPVRRRQPSLLLPALQPLQRPRLLPAQQRLCPLPLRLLLRQLRLKLHLPRWAEPVASPQPRQLHLCCQQRHPSPRASSAAWPAPKPLELQAQVLQVQLRC